MDASRLLLLLTPEPESGPTVASLTVNHGDVSWNDNASDPLVTMNCHTSYNKAFHAVGGYFGSTGDPTGFDKAAGTGAGNETISVIDIQSVLGDYQDDGTFYLDLDDGGSPESTQLVVRTGPVFIPKADWAGAFDVGCQVFDGTVTYAFMESNVPVQTYGICINVSGSVTGTIVSTNPTDHISIIAWDRADPGTEIVLAGPSQGTLTLTGVTLNTDARMVLKIVPDDVDNLLGVIKISGTTV